MGLRSFFRSRSPSKRTPLDVPGTSATRNLWTAGGLFGRNKVETALSLVPLTDATLALRARDPTTAHGIKPAKQRPHSCIEPLMGTPIALDAPAASVDNEMQQTVQKEMKQKPSLLQMQTQKQKPAETETKALAEIVDAIWTNETGTVRYRPATADMPGTLERGSGGRTAIIEQWRSELAQHAPEMPPPPPTASDETVVSTLAKQEVERGRLGRETTTPGEPSAHQLAVALINARDSSLPPYQQHASPFSIRQQQPRQRMPSFGVHIKHVKEIDPDRFLRQFVKVALVPLTRAEITRFVQLKEQKTLKAGHDVGPLFKGDVVAVLLQEQVQRPERPASADTARSSREQVRRGTGLRTLKLNASRFGPEPSEALWDLDPFSRQVFVVEQTSVGVQRDVEGAETVRGRGRMRSRDGQVSLDQAVMLDRPVRVPRRRLAMVGATGRPLSLFEPVSTIRLVKE